MTILTAADAVVANFNKHDLAGLIVIGGNSSMGTALRAEEREIPIVGIPKTIDNDVEGTDITIGFDTAVATGSRSYRPAQDDCRGPMIE